MCHHACAQQACRQQEAVCCADVHIWQPECAFCPSIAPLHHAETQAALPSAAHLGRHCRRLLDASQATCYACVWYATVSSGLARLSNVSQADQLLGTQMCCCSNSTVRAPSTLRSNVVTIYLQAHSLSPKRHRNRNVNARSQVNDANGRHAADQYPTSLVPRRTACCLVSSAERNVEALHATRLPGCRRAWRPGSPVACEPTAHVGTQRPQVGAKAHYTA